MKKYFALVFFALVFTASPALATSYFIDLTQSSTYSNNPNGWTTNIFFNDGDYSLTIKRSNSTSSFEEGVGYKVRYPVTFLLNTLDQPLEAVAFNFTNAMGQIAIFRIEDGITYEYDSSVGPGSYPFYPSDITGALTGEFNISAMYNEPIILTGITVYADSISAVPVPAAVWLMGSGLAGLMVARRKMN